jgi:fructose-1,6-bisphosphatase
MPPWLSLPNKQGEGGAGGRRSLLDVQPMASTNGFPFFLGNRTLVEKAETFMAA